MTASLRSSVFDVSASPQKHRSEQVEDTFQNSAGAHLTVTEVERRRIEKCLWKAFPEATSEHDLCVRAAEHFLDKKTGKPISYKAVKYWLRGCTQPTYMHTLALIRMVGVRVFFGGAD